MNEIYEYVASLCKDARAATSSLVKMTGAERDALLLTIGEELLSSIPEIEQANALDVQEAKANGIKQSMLDRLRFTRERITASAEALRYVAGLESPIGAGTRTVRPNGLVIEKTRVPLGTVGMIYEARPNVTIDAAALCLKTGNACVLRGGKEAINTNRATVAAIKRALVKCSADPRAVMLIERTERESSTALMSMRGLIDVLIPRGGAALIRSVAENATVPCIETGAGNCHVFINRDADVDMAVSITMNAKTSRPSVCNAAESLLVHADIAESFLPAFYRAAEGKVELRGCERTRAILPKITIATDEDFYTEYNDYVMSVKIVDTLDEAIEHINEHSTHHSEAIITGSITDSERFEREIDSACVYTNASTRFTDGGEFGLGAEIGISTQKLHARGPMGLLALCTEKFLVRGNGQIR